MTTLKLQNLARELMVLLLLLGGLSAATLAAAEDEGANTTFDGLVPLEETRVAMAYIDPDADFSVFERVAILDPLVAFRSNWQRDQNRSRTRNVRATDLERIKQDTAELWKQVFTEQLERAGFEVVNEAGDDVLVLRPAIIDLDVTAPDVRTPGRSSIYTATAGSATLYLQLFDSVTGDILGRAADRQMARRGGGFATRANRVTNRSDASRVFRGWADRLIQFLDQHYVAADQEQ